jgi:hypothetical protein
MEKRGKRKKSISDELDEIIERKKNEVSAWKKIAELLTNIKKENLKL